LTPPPPRPPLFPYTTLFRSPRRNSGEARLRFGQSPGSCVPSDAETRRIDTFTTALRTAARFRETFAAVEGEVAAQAHGGLNFQPDRKSTRLNSSHVKISYAV